MIGGGYILQPRSFDESDAAHLPPATREVWFYILRNVNHSDKLGLKRGQGFFTISGIQDALCWYTGYRKNTYSKAQITKALRRVCERNMTVITKTTRGMVITVCNYSEYQDPKNYEEHYEGIAKGQRREPAGHTINKNVKNEKNDKNVKEPKPLSRFAPPTLKEVEDYCAERGNEIDPEYFMDSNIAKGWTVGKGGVKMKDWKAVIRTWEKHSFSSDRKKSSDRELSTQDELMARAI